MKPAGQRLQLRVAHRRIHQAREFKAILDFVSTVGTPSGSEEVRFAALRRSLTTTIDMSQVPC